MATVKRGRMTRYNREDMYKAIYAETESHTVVCEKTSPVPTIRDMQKHFSNQAIEQDLIDLGLERYLKYV